MNRREAISRLALLMGGAIVGAEAFVNGSVLPGQPTGPGFSARDLALMDEIGETILPATSTPGAKAVGIGAFMAMMVNECYDPAHQAIFQAGLLAMEAGAQSQFGCSFVDALPAQRSSLLKKIDADARSHHDAQASGAPSHYFRLMKEITILGYFTSEAGCTQAIRYLEVPGSFSGDVPYKKGDRAWYTVPTRNLSD